MIFLGLVVGLSIPAVGPLAAVVVIGLAALPICIKYPRYPVYLFMLSSFFSGANINTGPFIVGLDDVAGLLLITVWLITRLSSRGKVYTPAGFGWLLLYAGLGFLSLVNGVSPDGYYGIYIRLLSRIIALFAFVDLVREEALIVKCLYCLGASAIIHAIIAFSFDQSTGDRFGGLSDQPNLLGTTLSLGLIPLVGLSQIQRSVLTKLFSFAAVVLIAIAVILTGSRGVYLALIPALVWSARRFPSRIILIGILGALSLFSANEYSEKQVQSIERRLQFRDVSTGKRANVLDIATRLTMKFPLLGIGFGQISHAYKAINVEYDRGRTAHSFLVGIAASMGLPALFAMLMFLWSQVRDLLSHRRWLLRHVQSDGSKRWLSEQALTLVVFQFLSLLTRSAQMFDWATFALITAVVCIMKRTESSGDQGEVEGGVGLRSS